MGPKNFIRVYLLVYIPYQKKQLICTVKKCHDVQSLCVKHLAWQLYQGACITHEETMFNSYINWIVKLPMVFRAGKLPLFILNS